eukprot:scaffold8852_cov29-Phaeocystis_antarctica.AAC.2
MWVQEVVTVMLLRGLASPAKLQRLSGRPLDQDIFCARASFMHAAEASLDHPGGAAALRQPWVGSAAS